MVYSSQISIKQTSEPIFNFEVGIDLTTSHSPALNIFNYNTFYVETYLRNPKKHHRFIFKIFPQIHLHKIHYQFGCIEHSKNADPQYQIYSTYKSHNTLKKLIIFTKIFFTKSGSISYISEADTGSRSDGFITEDTNIAAIFTPGFIVLCILPAFVGSKRQFILSEVYQGKRIVRARIHIERVMGRLKEFKLLNHILPISMIDL